MKHDRPDTMSNEFVADDPRLKQLVLEYLDRLESGQRPSRENFLSRHPDLAEPLAQCLDGLELVHNVAALRKASSHSPATHDMVPANPLGDFQIVREIGRGGMGIVYEAVQLSLGRRVALKVLPFAATFDNRQLQRFRNEAQAAAHLHHTNIVPVFAVGCERGVHFYAMQLIEGQSLAAVIRQLRFAAGRIQQTPHSSDPSLGPSVCSAAKDITTPTAGGLTVQSNLSEAYSHRYAGNNERYFRAAAELVAQAAEAVDHAHNLGIVHRDIKPENLLVESTGRVWITDFGLAHFHAEVGMTRTGDVVGTLRYMSPEQANGQRHLLDHRTDVYSLGATLYELVTLEPPFAGQNRQELVGQITGDDPRAPRSLDKAISTDLSTIILKALSKVPTERYDSARELAADLKRYLEDKPIRAKPPSACDRLRKWSRRHPAVMAAAGVLVLTCLVALLVISHRERQRAREADKRFQQARQAVDLLVKACNEELADLPSPLQGVRTHLLEMALAYYESFVEEQSGNPQFQAELADGQKRVQAILKELTSSREIHQLLLAVIPEVQDHLKLSKDQRMDIARLGEPWTDLRDERHQLLGRERFLTKVKLLAEILTAAQLRRLEQIELQLQGPMAFRDRRVAKALQLNSWQQEQIRDAKEQMLVRMPPPSRPAKKSGEGSAVRNKKAKGFAMEGIVSVLTPEQQERWREMTGEPFDAHFRPTPGTRWYRRISEK